LQNFSQQKMLKWQIKKSDRMKIPTVRRRTA
jgi:hypothetical protein